MQGLVRERRDELVHERRHRAQGGGPPLLVHHGDRPVGTGLPLEGRDEGLVQVQARRARLPDVAQWHVVDIERHGGH